MARSLQIFLVVALVWLAQQTLDAAIFPQSTGIWPKSWPKELEVYREKSTTLGVGTGIQENIYTIPFESREEFEKIWPVLLKLTTPGSKVRLTVVGDDKKRSWGRFLKSGKPCVHVYAPSEGWSLNPKLGLETEELEKRHQSLVENGQLIHASSPWPKSVYGTDGSLPEYVVSYLDDADGKMKWKPGEIGDDSKGFYNRARVDIELVIDGNIIDLNRIRFPEHVVIVDKR